MTRWNTLGSLLLFGLVSGSLAAAPSIKPTPIGEKVPGNHSLRDLRGNGRSLPDFKENKALALIFLGTNCPVSNLYVPSVLELEKQFRNKGVQFLAIYPNQGEDLDQIAIHSYDRNIPFPVLKDINQSLADRVGVTRVPSVAIVDDEYRLVYRGRVDDRYGVSARRPKATRNDLAEALNDVVAGNKVRVPETEADGCLLDRGRETVVRADVTYHKHISPILQARCQACHRPEQTAPFSLLSYKNAVDHARMIKEVTTQRRMPPWHADPRHGQFTNDRRMTDKEIETLTAWVDAGMPEGDAKDAPRPIDWPTGWKLGKPDLVLEMPKEFEVPAEGSMPYQYFHITPDFKEDKWVTMAEARPGNASVVHHVVIYILPPGQSQPFGRDGSLSVLVGWAPGDLGLICPPNTALRIPKGSTLRFELHYTPNGTKTTDRSSVGITFTKKAPRFELFTNAFANESIRIPAGAQHHREEATIRFREDARLISLVPHMHWRGKSYFYEAIYPDGRKETLLSVPRWDFNWQNNYYFKEPAKIPKGTRLHAVAHWDNSRNNLLNPNYKEEVKFGLQTWEEMMVGWVAYVWERPEAAQELAKNPPSEAELFFERLDRNGDGFVTREEIPDRFKVFLFGTGAKLPDKVNQEEFTKMFETMRKQFQQPRPKPTTPQKKP